MLPSSDSKMKFSNVQQVLNLDPLQTQNTNLVLEARRRHSGKKFDKFVIFGHFKAVIIHKFQIARHISIRDDFVLALNSVGVSSFKTFENFTKIV